MRINNNILMFELEVNLTKIEKIDHQTVKIILTYQDMCNYNLIYDEMDYHDINTKKTILKIVRIAQAKTNIDMQSNKLYIEAFPCTDGGCILYINLIQTQQSQTSSDAKPLDSPFIFAFEHINDVVQLCQRLKSLHPDLIVKSSLVLMDSHYHLFLYTYCDKEQKLLSILKEYGEYLGTGAILAATIQEHGKALICENAIETMLEYLV